MNPTMVQQPRQDLTAGVLKRLLQIAILILIQAAALFVSAGRLDWLAGWAYLGLYVGIILVNAAIMLPSHPELAAERGELAKNVKSWDKLIMILGAVLGPGSLVVAGLDERFNWSPTFAVAIQISAWVVMGLGFGLFSWGMLTNAFFSSVVRIQSERGHTVVTGGPYRFMRHPGYLGGIVFTLAAPLMLGSLWALIPAVLLCAVIVVRTALEDRMLQSQLAGYQDYAGRVRYRLLPGIW